MLNVLQKVIWRNVLSFEVGTNELGNLTLSKIETRCYRNRLCMKLDEPPSKSSMMDSRDKLEEIMFEESHMCEETVSTFISVGVN